MQEVSESVFGVVTLDDILDACLEGCEWVPEHLSNKKLSAKVVHGHLNHISIGSSDIIPLLASEIPSWFAPLEIFCD